MRILSSLLLAAVVAGSAGPAVAAPRETGEARLATALAGRDAGKPVDCLYLHDIRSSEIIDRTAILYRTNGGKLYLNRPQSGEQLLDSDDVMITDTHTSQLCSVDTVKLVDRAGYFWKGSVGLGAFVPYTKPAAAR